MIKKYIGLAMITIPVIIIVCAGTSYVIIDFWHLPVFRYSVYSSIFLCIWVFIAVQLLYSGE